MDIYGAVFGACHEGQSTDVLQMQTSDSEVYLWELQVKKLPHIVVNKAMELDLIRWPRFNAFMLKRKGRTCGV